MYVLLAKWTDYTEWLESYSYVVSFFAPAFGGDAAAIGLAFLSAQGHYPLWTLFTFGVVGTVFADSVWFFIAKQRVVNTIRNGGRFSARYQKVEETVVRLSHSNDFLLLLLAKYIYGTRILTIFYVSLKELAFGKFLIYSSVTTVLWIIPICTIGWLAGMGFDMVLTMFRNVQLALAFLLVLVVLFYVIQRVIKRWLIQKRSP